MHSYLVVHYGEIGTKGNNRAVFERCLARNIISNLHPTPILSMRKVNQRFLLEVDQANEPDAMKRLGETFGISWYSAVESIELSYDKIVGSIVQFLQKAGGNKSFRITARRPNKDFPMTSTELAGRLGADVVQKLDLRVDLNEPDINVNVDILSDRALIYAQKVKGPGGLPVGVSGRVIHLLSGGIDSPVAAWLMMKRGTRLMYLHFFIARDPSEILDSKIIRILKRLSQYGRRSMMMLLPFSVYQAATADFPQKYEPVIFRAFMRRIAEIMAVRFEALAISTGDNLAQVASQTLHNIRSIDRDASLPILRPLLTFNKTEIIDAAKSIGTYELSIETYKDCCALLSRHPKTRANPEYIDLYLKKLDMDDLFAKIVSGGCLVVYEPMDGSIITRPLGHYFKTSLVRTAEQI